jgi:putative solute:sodium symporter small subunit
LTYPCYILNRNITLTRLFYKNGFYENGIKEKAMAFESTEHAQAYWKENLGIMGTLLAVWFAVSYGAGILFVDALNTVQFGGFKLGFWFAQQGSIYTFVALIFIYVVRMNALDKKYNVQED